MIEIVSLPSIPAVLRGSTVLGNKVEVHLLRNLFDAQLLDLEKTETTYDPMVMTVPLCRFRTIDGIDGTSYVPTKSPAYGGDDVCILYNTDQGLDIHLRVHHLLLPQQEWSFWYLNKHDERIWVTLSFLTMHIERTGPVSVVGSMVGPWHAARQYSFGFELQNVQDQPTDSELSGQGPAHGYFSLDTRVVSPLTTEPMAIVTRPVLYDPLGGNISDPFSAVVFSEEDSPLYSIHFKSFLLLPGLNIKGVITLPQSEAISESDAEVYNDYFDVLKVQPTLPFNAQEHRIVLYDNALQPEIHLFSSVNDIVVHDEAGTSSENTELVVRDQKLYVSSSKVHFSHPRAVTVQFLDGSDLHVYLYSIQLTRPRREGTLSTTSYVSSLERGQYPSHEPTLETLRIHQRVTHPRVLRVRQNVTVQQQNTTTRSRVHVGLRRASVTIDSRLAIRYPPLSTMHSDGGFFLIPHLKDLGHTLSL